MTHRLEGHRQPADLAAVDSHCAMGQLAREKVGLGEGVTLRMEQRQNGGEFITCRDERETRRCVHAPTAGDSIGFYNSLYN